MSKTWFVAGTDTGVGKTAVSCALMAAAAESGLRTAAVKPVAAGCDNEGQNDDALCLMAGMTEELEYSQVNPIALEAAIAPHIAASLEGKTLQASRLVGLCRGVMLGKADFVLIEGAGGWRVPINPRETLADLAIQLRVGVILVVGMRLGCINHALLTVGRQSTRSTYGSARRKFRDTAANAARSAVGGCSLSTTLGRHRGRQTH
jgi:dethiobiotin synthetase